MIDGRDVTGVRPVDDLQVLDPKDGPASAVAAAAAVAGAASTFRSPSVAPESWVREAVHPGGCHEEGQEDERDHQRSGGPHHHQNPRSTAVYSCDQ